MKVHLFHSWSGKGALEELEDDDENEDDNEDWEAMMTTMTTIIMKMELILHKKGCSRRDGSIL